MYTACERQINHLMSNTLAYFYILAQLRNHEALPCDSPSTPRHPKSKSCQSATAATVVYFSQSSERKQTIHIMFKLEIFLAFYTVGQFVFGIAMLACIGYLIWICRREDGETLNPLKGSFRDDDEAAKVVEKLKDKALSTTTLVSSTNSNSPGIHFT